jgi:hypothetical protein
VIAARRNAGGAYAADRSNPFFLALGLLLIPLLSDGPPGLPERTSDKRPEADAEAPVLKDVAAKEAPIVVRRPK